MEDDLFVIPDADGTAVLYNDGKIRFDEIADIEVGSVFVGILLRNGYQYQMRQMRVGLPDGIGALSDGQTLAPQAVGAARGGARQNDRYVNRIVILRRTIMKRLTQKDDQVALE